MTLPQDTNKFNLKTLKMMQFGVIVGLARYGKLFAHKIHNMVTPEVLINDEGKYYFQIIKAIIENDVDVDAVQMEEFSIFHGHGEYFKTNRKKILGVLDKIAEYQISQANALENARILTRRHYKNTIVEDLKNVIKRFSDLPDNTPSVQITNELVDVIRRSEAGNEDSDKIESLGSDIREYVEELMNGEPCQPGLDIGLPYLAEICGGIVPGAVHVVASRMKVGKSSLLLNICLNTAKNKVPVLYLDMELSKRQNQQRALANLAQVNLDSIIYKTFQKVPKDVKKIHNAAEVMEELPVTWRKVSGLNYNQYLNFTRRWIAEEVGFDHKGKALPCLVVLDYIKLSGDLGSNISKKDHELLGTMAKKIKEFAMEYEIPIFTAVQLNRDGKIFGSDQIAMEMDTILEYARKSPGEIAQDNADLGSFCGNSKIVQSFVRQASAWDPADYIAMHYDGSLMTCQEYGRKSVFMKHQEKPKRPPRNRKEGEVPT